MPESAVNFMQSHDPGTAGVVKSKDDLIILDEQDIVHLGLLTIIYYCCQTSYTSNESGEYTGLTTDAIGTVIDFAQIKTKWECKVNEYGAFQCDLGEQTYLC